MPPLSLPAITTYPVVLGLLDNPESIPWQAVSGTASAPVANTAYAFKVRFPRPLTLTGIKYGIGAASGNADVGLYNSADGGTTLTRLTSSGSTAVVGTNAVQSVSFTASVVVVPGVDYWVAVAFDNATVTVSRLGANNFVAFDDVRAASKATSFPLPTSITGHAATSNLIWLRTVGS